MTYDELMNKHRQILTCGYLEIGPGWYNLIDNLCTDLQAAANDSTPIHAVQVKQKFGQLRFYVDGGNNIQHSLISIAEARSATICEECGEEGKIVSTGGWLRTVCDKHAGRAV